MQKELPIKYMVVLIHRKTGNESVAYDGDRLEIADRAFEMLKKNDAVVADFRIEYRELIPQIVKWIS